MSEQKNQKQLSGEGYSVIMNGNDITVTAGDNFTAQRQNEAARAVVQLMRESVR